MPFAIIPVLDIKDGLSVHAVGGIRDRYQPLRTILHEGSRPIDIARAYRDRLGLPHVYIADLDAILGKPPSIELYASLADEGINLILDPGVRDLEYARDYDLLPFAQLIIGLESVRGPAEARAVLEHVGPNRLVFSIDQFNDRPMVSAPNLWDSTDTAEIAERVISMGFEHLILLDLARVGTGRGTGSAGLLSNLRQANPVANLLIGGGVSGIGDIHSLRKAGASGVLLGSVLHDGRIGRDEIDSLISRDETQGNYSSRFHS